MLETQRPWSGGYQRKNSVGLGTLKFLLSFCICVYMCVARSREFRRRRAFEPGGVRNLVVHLDLQVLFSRSILTTA